jgi:hypothetical protein
MGFHVGWFTVRGKTPTEIRAELGLVETDAREYVPESELTAVPLPSGWYMVFCNDLTATELEDERLAALSRGADVMAFFVEEASMVSLARGYAAGRRIWEVVHDSSKGHGNLETEGVLPPSFPEVHDRLAAELAADGHGADYLFDVAADLSRSITGFRHDEDIEGVEGDAFAVFERV